MTDVADNRSVSKRWVVVRNGSRGGHNGSDWFTSRKEADDRAIHMASRNPGIRYVVMETVGTVLLPLNQPGLMVEPVE